MMQLNIDIRSPKSSACPRGTPNWTQTEEEKRQFDDGDSLSPSEVTRYTRIAARVNFLAQDRMDIASAAREAKRSNNGTPQVMTGTNSSE